MTWFLGFKVDPNLKMKVFVKTTTEIKTNLKYHCQCSLGFKKVRCSRFKRLVPRVAQCVPTVSWAVGQSAMPNLLDP